VHRQMTYLHWQVIPGLPRNTRVHAPASDGHIIIHIKQVSHTPAVYVMGTVWTYKKVTTRWAQWWREFRARVLDSTVKFTGRFVFLLCQYFAYLPYLQRCASIFHYPYLEYTTPTLRDPVNINWERFSLHTPASSRSQSPSRV